MDSLLRHSFGPNPAAPSSTITQTQSSCRSPNTPFHHRHTGSAFAAHFNARPCHHPYTVCFYRTRTRLSVQKIAPPQIYTICLFQSMHMTLTDYSYTITSNGQLQQISAAVSCALQDVIAYSKDSAGRMLDLTCMSPQFDGKWSRDRKR